MKQNKQLQKTVSKLADLSFQDGRIIESRVIQSIKILKSLPKYEAIEALSDYLKDLKRQQRQYTMYVETTAPLSISQLQRIKKIVEKRHRITKIETKINPEILGGFKLKVGDEIWDESVLGRIGQVKEAIRG